MTRYFLRVQSFQKIGQRLVEVLDIFETGEKHEGIIIAFIHKVKKNGSRGLTS